MTGSASDPAECRRSGHLAKRAAQERRRTCRGARGPNLDAARRGERGRLQRGLDRHPVAVASHLRKREDSE